MSLSSDRQQPLAAAAPPGRLTVAVLGGGPSAEHEVSLASARSVREGLLEAGHAVLSVEIDRDGNWQHEGRRLRLLPSGGLLEADVVFPALHGRFGEDGTLQGVLETLAVPYVGSGIAASALCMNKVLFKDLMSAHGLPQVRYVAILERSFAADPQASAASLDGLGLPLFVKPVHMGSSLGIAKVTARAQIEPVLRAAFEHDSLVIVESLAGGIEVECSVLGSPGATDAWSRALGADAVALGDGPSGDLLVSGPGEITYAADWYDYATKYTPGAMELVIPARISAAADRRVRELAAECFLRAGCEGLARVDFFVDGDQVLLNELNTMPGFTPTSVYAKLLAACGVGYHELVDRLCRLALTNTPAPLLT